MRVREAVGRTSHQGVAMLLLSRVPQVQPGAQGITAPKPSVHMVTLTKISVLGPVGYEESVDTDCSLQTE